MSEDFIPLNQSTPVQGCWQPKSNFNQSGYQNNWQRRNHRRRGQPNRWRHNYSQQSTSFGSDSNSSCSRDHKSNIDAYLHPSMLKDPWEHLRRQIEQGQTK